jgi:hypothetical protein
VLLGIIWLSLELFNGRRCMLPWLLIALVAADLEAASWLRPVDFAPRGRLVEQSPTLTFLAAHAPGQRVMDSNLNLAMLAEAAPVVSYRTVDLPIWHNSLVQDASTLGAMIPQGWKGLVYSRCDVRWEIVAVDPTAGASWKPETANGSEVLTDPVLGRIIYGPGLSKNFPGFAARFVIRRVDANTSSRAWFASASGDLPQFQEMFSLATGGSRRFRFPWDRRLLGLLSKPLSTLRYEPESQEYELEATGPGTVVLSQPAFPGWECKLREVETKDELDAAPSQSGCLVVPIARAGKYRLELRARSHSYELGRSISLFALLCWAVLISLMSLMTLLGKRNSARRGIPPVEQVDAHAPPVAR